ECQLLRCVARSAYRASCPRLAATFLFFFSSRRRHTRFKCDWSSDVCSSDLDRASEIRGNGEADALVATGSVSDDRGIDSDQLTAVVDQGAAGIARIDGRVGLDKVLVVFNAEVAAARRAYDAFGDGLSNAKGI